MDAYNNAKVSVKLLSLLPTSYLIPHKVLSMCSVPVLRLRQAYCVWAFV